MAQDREAVLQKRGACCGNPTYLVEGDELPEKRQETDCNNSIRQFVHAEPKALGKS